MSSNTQELPGKARIRLGTEPNHWLFDPTTISYDLTRPKGPSPPHPHSKSSISLSTTTTPIAISPDQTALVIIDMQNLFLDPAAHPDNTLDNPINLAKNVLLETAIPAARKAGIRIVWIGWGFVDEELDSVPPSLVKVFGFQGKPAQVANAETEVSLRNLVDRLKGTALDFKGEGSQLPKLSEAVEERIEGLGFDIGPIKLNNGDTVQAGRRLMRGTWNTALPPDLNRVYQEGLKLNKPDIWIHQNRVSGFWHGKREEFVEVLKNAGIKTLLFAGTKTDMCVQASLLDAWHEGFDVILLKDACGTTSPRSVSDAVEFNCARIWGFVTSSGDLDRGVEEMLEESSSRADLLARATKE